MRLTLRTMLAYLDDILAPQDSEDIAKKIEESEFATELVHRTRDCMRRLRLGVPPVTGKGLAADANTVAEYLDNTLSADRVGEFERICLESDIHLAEVASCHQILTLVLGEPAEIDARSRGRMYRIAADAEAPPVQAEVIQPVAAMSPAPAGGGAGPAVPPAPPRRPKPEVPEYLRESRTRWWPVAAAALVGALVTVAALVLLAPAEWRERFTGVAQVEEPATEPPAASQQPPTTPPDVPPAVPPATGAVDAPGDAATPPAPAASEAPPAPSGADAAAPEPTPGEVPMPADAVAPQPPAEAPAADAAASRPAAEPGLPKPADPEPPAPLPAEPPPAAASPAAAPAGDSPEQPIPPGPGDLAPADPSAAPAADAAAADAAADVAFGRYTSKRGEVLLRLDPDSGDWKRLPPMSPLAKGDKLLSLPVFRPSIALSTSVSIQPDGPAELALIGWTPDGVPIIAIDYGRLLMMTVGKAGNAIQLKLGEQNVELTFVDAESTLALEVGRTLTPGKDPMAEAAPLGVDLYATSGSVRVRLGDEAPIDLQAPARRSLLGDGIAPPGEVPSWVTSEALSDFDRRATSTLESLLPADQFAGLILKELASDRRREVRSLAIRSAAYLGNFDTCINALNEKYEKNFWPDYIEALRAGVAHSPEMAKRVHDALERLRGVEGERLFRMLCGYSAADLENGAAADLVEDLNHESLDARVLAFWNLQQITGLPNYGYAPENLTKNRTAAVNRWKTQLRQGKIVPRAAAAGASKAKAAASPE
jgi:hypothetical protein